VKEKGQASGDLPRWSLDYFPAKPREGEEIIVPRPGIHLDNEDFSS